MCKQIHDLIEDTLRYLFQGEGKPEALKENLQGLWSRRINKEHRMVYAVTKETLFIVQLRYHY